MVEEVFLDDIQAPVYAFGLVDIRHGSGDAVQRTRKFSSLQSVSEKIVGGTEGLSRRIHVDGPPGLFVEQLPDPVLAARQARWLSPIGSLHSDQIIEPMHWGF